MSLINRFLISAPLLALTVLAPAIGHAQESESIEVPEINIIGITPMPGLVSLAIRYRLKYKVLIPASTGKITQLIYLLF